MTGRWGKEPVQFFLDELPDDIRVSVLSLFDVGRTDVRLKTKE